jgi:CRP-like cAMP-binding protein
MRTNIGYSIPVRQHSPLDNTLLNLLPHECYQQLLKHLQKTRMQSGEIVPNSEHPPQYLYFPTTSIFSKNYIMADGSSTKVAMIGKEGLVGVNQLIGGDSPTCSHVVQSGGYAYRVKKCLLETEFNKGGVLEHILLLYAQMLITQISQTIVCNRLHTIEQQLCRWLLLCIDRLDTNNLYMTHEQIALNLGVRRESVSVAAHHLQSDNIIRYRRGLISVLDRRQLEDRVCECYSVVQYEYNRLFETTKRGLSVNPRQLHGQQAAIH